MNKIYGSKCNKHKKIKNPEMSYVFDKASVFFLFAISVAVMKNQYLKKNNQVR